ncbi:MAG: hypothetical protein J6126_06015 [Clostridia bacterium]|nr:hypothetical protein [Clostridia bacterium]
MKTRDLGDFSHFKPQCFDRRVTIFGGHYGSGKTNAATSYALALKSAGRKVGVFDLDIVNPYFRTKDAAEIFESAGIDLVASEYANTNVDIPAMTAEFYRLTGDRSSFAVADVGGDDRGALALGRYKDEIIRENDYNFLFVLNRFRPETRTVSGAERIMREIEKACGIPFTGVVNNPNLGAETTAETINSSFAFASEFCAEVGLNIEFSCVLGRLMKNFEDKNVLPVLPIKIGDWAEE